MPVANTEAAADLPICKSACGIMVVTTDGVTLFVRLGSPVGDPTVATFVSVPLVDAVTVKVTLLTAPLAKLPKFKMTTAPLFAPPPVVPTKLTPAGNASVTVILPAVEGPKFVTEIV